jgi:hypothetical protein
MLSVNGYLRTSPAQESTFSRVLSIVAYPIAIAVGLTNGRLYIRQQSYEMFRRQGAWGDIVANTKAICERARNNAINGVLVDGKPVNARQEIRIARSNFTKKISEEFKKMGYTNVFHHYSTLSPNEKLRSVFAITAAMGVTLGILLTVANSKSLWLRVSEKKDAQRDSSQTVMHTSPAR